MKKQILFLLMALPLSALAQSPSDVAKSINSVKRDTMCIYAEATTKSLQEAYDNARAILEMKVGEWVRQQHPDEGIEVCIVKAKDHFLQFDTRRGELYRAFVYVRKSDIMPVADKGEVTVFQVPATTTEATVAEEIVSEDAPVEAKKAPVLTLTQEEQRMKQVESFYDVEPYVKKLQQQGRITAYGKYANMPADGNCHLFVYDRQGRIAALLRKTGAKQYNLNTLKEDDVKNYKNCGAFWLQLKD